MRYKVTAFGIYEYPSERFKGTVAIAIEENVAIKDHTDFENHMAAALSAYFDAKIKIVSIDDLKRII